MNLEKLLMAEKEFLTRYPKGFSDPEMEEIAKKHRPDKMKSLALESFRKELFDDADAIVESMVKVISRSSMVSVFEKPKFKDLVKILGKDERAFLAHGLFQMLYQNQEDGFQKMVDILREHKLAKWTILTACPYYFRPQTEVFIKPTTTKGVISAFQLENIEYSPKPSFDFYSQYRDYINNMKKHVDPLLQVDNAAFCGFLMITMGF